MPATEDWPEGIKKTKQRESVLAILENAASPMSAIDIYKSIEKTDKTAWLSTVYRILELFVKENVAVKTTFPDDDMAYYELCRQKHRHYAVCMSCHKRIQIDACPLEKVLPALEGGDFQVTGHNLEVYGVCKNCRGK